MLEPNPGNFGTARVPYDWYQTQTHVIITIRISNLKENDVKVTIINDALDVMCQLLDGRQFRMHFNLYKTVIVPDSNWAVDTSKLVINLRKADRKRWHSLEIIPDKNGNRPKSFIGIVTLHTTKNELHNLLSVAEFESKENSTNAITITQTRHYVGPDGINEPISLDYNWYQDEKYINIVIHVPNIRLPENRSFLFYEDDINIILTDNSLNWICSLPTGVTNVTFKLYKEINSSESRYEISPCRSKIEIKLRKTVDAYWPSFVIQTNNNARQDDSEEEEGIEADENENDDDHDKPTDSVMKTRKSPRDKSTKTKLTSKTSQNSEPDELAVQDDADDAELEDNPIATRTKRSRLMSTTTDRNHTQQIDQNGGSEPPESKQEATEVAVQ